MCVTNPWAHMSFMHSILSLKLGVISDVFTTFKSFVKAIHNEFETTIKRVRSDNGSEFKNTRIDELYDEFEIRHQFSAKYIPQSNGLVERKK